MRGNRDLSAVPAAGAADPGRPLRRGAHPPVPGLRVRPDRGPAGRRAARRGHRALARRRHHRGPADHRGGARLCTWPRERLGPAHDRGLRGRGRPAARLGRAARPDRRDPQRHRRRRVRATTRRCAAAPAQRLGIADGRPGRRRARPAGADQAVRPADPGRPRARRTRRCCWSATARPAPRWRPWRPSWGSADRVVFAGATAHARDAAVRDGRLRRRRRDRRRSAWRCWRRWPPACPRCT